MIVLGLGSSLAPSLDRLRRAVARLKREPGLRMLRVSPVYESDAMLPAGAPESWRVPYFNMAVSAVYEGEDPVAFLHKIKSIERELGRRERERWSPREIDIDILAWERTEIRSEILGLPHKGLLERPFALLPLLDVAPEWEHPQAGRATRDLAESWRRQAVDDVPFRTRRSLSALTELVGIVNLTPDSFSDGGRLANEEAIAGHVEKLVEAGATVLDFGAESTRPGARPVEPAEEWRRLRAGLDAAKRAGAPFKTSVDTRHPEVLENVLARFAIDWINDVEGFARPRMRALARESGADLVFMHSLGVPPAKDRVLSRATGVADQLMDWAREQAARFEAEGIAPERLIFDPGIGFGKAPDQNLAVLRDCARFHASGLRLLIGHSRKSFLDPIVAREPAERDLETALLSAELAARGVEYLRVHDVDSQARALRLWSVFDGVARWRT